MSSVYVPSGVGKGYVNAMLEFRRLCNAFAYGDCVKYLLRNIEFVFDGEMIECYKVIPDFCLKNFGFFRSVVFTDCCEGAGEFLDVISHSPSIRHLHSLQIWYGLNYWPTQQAEEKYITQEQLRNFISKCTSLHSLRLRCCNNIKSLEFIKGSNVYNLNLFMCDNLTSLSGIHGSKVHMLHLFNNEDIVDEFLEDLKGLSNLYSLSTDNCAKVASVDDTVFRLRFIRCGDEIVHQRALSQCYKQQYYMKMPSDL